MRAQTFQLNHIERILLLRAGELTAHAFEQLINTGANDDEIEDALVLFAAEPLWARGRLSINCIWRRGTDESSKPARSAWRHAGARLVPGRALLFGQFALFMLPPKCAVHPPRTLV